MLEISQVTKPADINLISVLAREIWTRHYVPIVGKEQVDYMLDKFQSVPAIAAQLASGYEYYILKDGNRLVGYFTIVPNQNESSALLSKIYIKHDCRGHGFGKMIIRYLEKYCSDKGIKKLWLTVNRNNTSSIAFYKHTGFTDEGPVIQDIGRGFVMDDYKMSKTINPESGC